MQHTIRALGFVAATVAIFAACGDDEGVDTPGLEDGGSTSSSSSSGASGASGSSSGGSGSSSSGDAGGSSSGDAGGSSSGDAGEPQDGGDPSDAGDGGGEPLGEVIEAPALTWTWIDFPESRCRNNSTTGIGVSLNPASDKVMIYLQGGGACFNTLTCSQNPASFGPGNLGSPSSGIFDRSDAQNPVKDYSMVFVPYCTGDVHAGNAPNKTLATVVGAQQFVGYANITAYLHRLVPTFAGASQVLLTGESAGGFGAAANFEHVQRAFGAIPVTLIDDSGPPLDSSVVTSCLQREWREAWGLDGTLIADCGAACDNPNDYLSDYVASIRARHPNMNAGLISSNGDDTIRFFFGFGANNCQSFLSSVSVQDFERGLRDFRTSVQTPGPKFGTFYIQSTTHTWLSSRYTETVGGVQLRSWVSNILAGGAVQHLGLN